MKRKIIKIDEEKCNGCSLCAKACHEGAIGMVNGKAKLLRDDYCDGMGDCLPACPTGAISFEHREAAAYDEIAVQKNKQENKNTIHQKNFSCPGNAVKVFNRIKENQNKVVYKNDPVKTEQIKSQLNQWPVQIKLVPVNAPYFSGSHLLIAADCTSYAYANFHNEFMKNKITLIGCPKLDSTDYSEKLTEILEQNEIKSLTIVRMEVPCCGGIERACITALKNSGKFIPWNIVTISTDGNIIQD
ncbi:MAG: ATP-binding protein [Treponemataceae bacterium]